AHASRPPLLTTRSITTTVRLTRRQCRASARCCWRGRKSRRCSAISRCRSASIPSITSRRRSEARMIRTFSFLSLIATLAAQQASLPAPVPVTVVNTIAIARPAETITLTAAALKEHLPFTDLRMVHVYSGTKDLLTQAIDIDDDGTLDELIFQVDLASRETK